MKLCQYFTNVPTYTTLSHVPLFVLCITLHHVPTYANFLQMCMLVSPYKCTNLWHLPLYTMYHFVPYTTLCHVWLCAICNFAPNTNFVCTFISVPHLTNFTTFLLVYPFIIMDPFVPNLTHFEQCGLWSVFTYTPLHTLLILHPIVPHCVQCLLAYFTVPYFYYCTTLNPTFTSGIKYAYICFHMESVCPCFSIISLCFHVFPFKLRVSMFLHD